MNESRPMAKLRWSKFWWGDWQNDAALRMCGFAARGVWLEMLAIMHAAEPTGHLLINGRSPSMKQLAALAGGQEREVSTAVQELEDAGVFSRTQAGVIFSRRMVRDKAMAEKGRENGSKGGNPALNPDPTTPDKGSDKAGGKPRGLTPPLGQPLKLEAEAEAEEERKAAKHILNSDPRELETERDAMTRVVRMPGMPQLGDPVEAWMLLADRLPNGSPAIITGEFSTELVERAKRANFTLIPNRPEEIGQPTVNGSPIKLLAEAVCAAAKIHEVGWRGDWKPLIGWLRDGIPPECIVETIRQIAKRPGYRPPNSLNYFDKAVRTELKNPIAVQWVG